jgi:hypothetical protein
MEVWAQRKELGSKRPFARHHPQLPTFTFCLVLSRCLVRFHGSASATFNFQLLTIPYPLIQQLANIREANIKIY